MKRKNKKMCIYILRLHIFYEKWVKNENQTKIFYINLMFNLIFLLVQAFFL
jgi:hypothetical protein